MAGGVGCDLERLEDARDEFVVMFLFFRTSPSSGDEVSLRNGTKIPVVFWGDE